MKEALRKKLIQKRKNLSLRQRKTRNKKIQDRLEKFAPYKKAKTVFLYVSKPDEVDTRAILMYLLKQKKKVVVPKVHAKKPHLHLVHLREIHHLQKGQFDILEPKSHHPKVQPGTIELAIVPGVAFDALGHRIGYGKGYYDRALKKMKAKKIGLAYDFQVVAQIPADRYDVPVDFLITNKKTYDCSANR